LPEGIRSAIQYSLANGRRERQRAKESERMSRGKDKEKVAKVRRPRSSRRTDGREQRAALFRSKTTAISEGQSA